MKGIREFDDGLRLHPYLDAYNDEDETEPDPTPQLERKQDKRKAVNAVGDSHAR